MSLLFSILLLLSACSGTQEEGTDGNSGGDLPEKAEKIKVTWGDGGGMLDLSTQIYISNDSCSWNYRKNGYEKHIGFEVSESELNGLYKVFVDNEFNKIKARSEGEVYDRGGVGISLDVDGEFYRADNSGSNFIEADWTENWRNVSSAITSLADSKMEEKKFEARVLLDESILELNYPMNVSVDGPILYTSDDGPMNPNQRAEGFKVQLLEGPTEIDVYLFYPDSLNSYGGKATYLWASEGFDFSPENNTATFYLEGEKLLLK